MTNPTFNFIDVEIPDFDPEFFALWVSKVVDSYGLDLGDLSYVFCSDDYLLDMNKEHLNHDFYTDIVTFNYNSEGVVSGDLFISVDRVRENAIEFGDGDFYNELCRVMIHGVLHLLGFNDKTEEEEKEMRVHETKCLILR
jgi:probable rRNA maturation factor